MCSEVTTYVIKRNDVNFSFLYVESRKNGIFGDCELLCGIPANLTNELINAVIKIANEKPIPKEIITFIDNLRENIKI